MPFRIFVLFIVVLTVLGCGKSSSPSVPDAAKPPTREDLIASLVALGDDLSTKEEKWRAIFPYEFALGYAKDDAEIAKKLELVEGSHSDAFFSLEEANHALWVIKNISHRLDLEDWAASDHGIELVELRILTDEHLVGNLQCGEVSIDVPDNQTEVIFGKPMMFTAIPKITLAEVLTSYGEPSATKKYPDGITALTYGRIRILCDKEENVAAVIFRPDLTIQIKAIEK